MTLPEVISLYRYWEIDPPEHEMIALIATAFGYKRAEPTVRPAALEERTAFTPRSAHGNVIRADSKENMLRAVQQFQMLAGHVGQIQIRSKSA